MSKHLQNQNKIVHIMTLLTRLRASYLSLVYFNKLAFVGKPACFSGLQFLYDSKH